MLKILFHIFLSQISRRGLSEEEIYTTLSIGEDSKDGLDSDDSIEDPIYFHEGDESTSDEFINITASDEQTTIPTTTCISISENAAEPPVNSSDGSYEGVKSFRSVIGKRKYFVDSEDRVSFRRSDRLASKIKNLGTPYELFMFFFTDDLLSLITNETSLFSTQKDPNKLLQNRLRKEKIFFRFPLLN